MKERYCRLCKVNKPTDDFYRYDFDLCKKCRIKLARERYLRHGNKIGFNKKYEK